MKNRKLCIKYWSGCVHGQLKVDFWVKYEIVNLSCAWLSMFHVLYLFQSNRFFRIEPTISISFFQSAKSILRQNCQRMRIGEGGSQPDTFWTHFKVSIKLEALLGPKNYWQLRNLCMRVGVCVWENFHFSFFFFEWNSLPKVEAEPRYIMAKREHMTFLRLKALVSWLLWSNWDVDVAGTHIKFPTCLEGQQTW